MPYLIDGHNLIPKIPGMNLGDVDDETQLIEMLQEFCRRRRKQVKCISTMRLRGSRVPASSVW
jgi:hypothetical protein